MDQEKIGAIIKEIRLKNNLTQLEFANKYGVTYQAVSKWENGKNMPDIALMKQICTDFNINIEDVLNGKITKNKKNNHFKIIIISIIITIILTSIITVLFFKQDNTFSFKTLEASCEQFTLSGSIAYNKSKTSLYIDNLKYHGEEDNTLYKNIECILYENDDGKITEIAKYEYQGNELIKLEDFVSNINFKIDSYDRTCKRYSKNSLYLIINASESDTKTTSYKVPLTIYDCK